MDADALAQDFNEYRPRLLGIAYRMLGSAWDAEDVVAEAMVRWMRVDRERIRQPLAFLTTVVTRLAIDQLRSARATRETYVGQWLPEPVATDASRLGPLDTIERRETVSLATLRMMETLTPPERAVLVLHEAFDMSHAEVADILGITEVGARQHLRRARSRLERDVERSGRAIHDLALDRFLAALEDGDLVQVQDLLAADVASYSDGGGRAHAARQPVLGAEHIVQYIGTLRRHRAVRDVRRVDVNGEPAATLWFGRQFALLALDVRAGEIREIHWIMNPDKLRYLQQQLSDADEAPTMPSWRAGPVRHRPSS
jgi:RNA polymerase sigma-70 factor (ECF subfamily)